MSKNLIALVFIAVNLFCFAQKEKNLVAKYSFNSGIPLEDLGKFNPKLYQISFVEDRFGNPSSACFLQGAKGSYMNLGTDDGLKPKEGSISLWINVAHGMRHGMGVKSNPILYTRSHAGEDFNEAFYMGYDYESENLNCNVSLNEENQVPSYAINKLRLREWHHTVLCYNKEYLWFYVDGELQGKLPKNFNSQFLSGDSILIGNRIDSKNQRFLSGTVDDIEIYNKVLSQKEVLELYNSPDPNKNKVILNWTLIIITSIIGLGILVFLIISRVKYLVKKEKARNQAELNSLEQQIKMLKAQMDPHFIFNSMNTILQFIVTNENEKAEMYLTKFSKLIRKLLESNTRESITLEDEIDILNKYLEIEALRFDSKIETNIEISKDIDVYKTLIPHMMIQPFVENAVWHGLRQKEGAKKLNISFTKVDEKTLYCVIDDNGVGRKRKVETQNSLNQSLAINFIEQRLELMSKKYDGLYSLVITDKTGERGESLGTTVEIVIPIINL